MNPFSLYWKSSWAVSSLASAPEITTDLLNMFKQKAKTLNTNRTPQTYLPLPHLWCHWSCCSDWGSQWRHLHHWRAAQLHAGPLRIKQWHKHRKFSIIKFTGTAQPAGVRLLRNPSTTQVLQQIPHLSNQWRVLCAAYPVLLLSSHMKRLKTHFSCRRKQQRSGWSDTGQRNMGTPLQLQPPCQSLCSE